MALAAWSAAPAEATTETFHYTGGEQMFAVPAGVHKVQVVAIGGHGENATSATGGKAAEVSGTLSFSPGDTLYVEVGANGSAGGFNGGGAGGANGGAKGGGASDIRTASQSVPLTTEDTRLLVAAGGGGGAGNGVEYIGAAGGDAGGSGESDEVCGNGGGEPGTAGAGGLAGGGEGGVGEDGQLGVGGDGSNTSEEGGGGGGGGGGYYGGGGGGAGLRLCGGGGGGGGSSLVPSLGFQTLSSAQPKVEIGWFPPPSVTITTPANEATYTQGQVVNANYSCLPGEGTSLKSCTGPVANGAPLDTSILGERTFTVEAEDNDSGKSSRSVGYTVVPKPSTGGEKESSGGGEATSGLATALGIAPVKGGKAQLKMRCKGDADCAGTAKLFARLKAKKRHRRARAQKQSRQVLIGSAAFSIPAGTTKIVPVRLSRRAKARVRKAGRRGFPVKLKGPGVKGRTVVLKGPRRRGHR